MILLTFFVVVAYMAFPLHSSVTSLAENQTTLAPVTSKMLHFSDAVHDYAIAIFFSKGPGVYL